ncbi:MAG: RNA 2',3'-cyclic phosphodiesterase [Anaerolineaceae bacterium]
MMIRSFFAIPLSTEIKDGIFMETKRIKSELPGANIKWVEPQNLHLTLKFLGNSSDKDLYKIVEHLQNEIHVFKNFMLSFSNLGIFPSIKNPKVVWVGCDQSKLLQQLFSIIESVCTIINIPYEEKPFSPHITIGRVKNSFSTEELDLFRKIISELKTKEFGAQEVMGFSLLRSVLTPTGPIYTPIHKFMFSK